MLPADRPRFAQVFAALAEMYAKPMSDAALSMWWKLLQPYDVADVERAAQAHMLDAEKGRFMPLPADFTRLIEGGAGDRAAVAFEKVRTAIRSVGCYRSVVFDDPLIHVCIEHLGGWTRICDWSSEEVPFRQREFADHYRANAVRREVPPYTAVLMGEHDLANRNRFPEAVKPPVFIGDHALALAVMQSGGERRVSITDASSVDLSKALKVVKS